MIPRTPTRARKMTALLLITAMGWIGGIGSLSAQGTSQKKEKGAKEREATESEAPPDCPPGAKHCLPDWDVCLPHEKLEAHEERLNACHKANQHCQAKLKACKSEECNKTFTFWQGAGMGAFGIGVGTVIGFLIAK